MSAAHSDPPLVRRLHESHDLALHYWNKPETADCTLLIPVANRRDTRGVSPHMSLHLHRDYISAKSAFLRGLLSGMSPLDLIQSRFPSHLQPLHLPQSRLPRILPSPPSHPIIFLPIPDPSSIHFIIHWIYFGNTDYIENALDKGDIRWERLVHNVEYLGLTTDIKSFLGCWYRNWFLPCCPRTSCLTDDDIDDGDEDDGDEAEDLDDWDFDFDDCHYPANMRTIIDHVAVASRS